MQKFATYDNLAEIYYLYQIHALTDNEFVTLVCRAVDATM